MVREALTKLILVKHSLPAIEPDVPASRWQLGEEGRRRCGVLAQALTAYRPAEIVCSEEPKAAETARLVAAAWGQGCTVRPGLHEHRRETVGWLGAEAFEASVARLFAEPNRLVFGEETAAEALTRFSGAVAEAAGQSQAAALVIVAHGTVMALYAAAVAGVDGFALWRRLGLPSIVVLHGLAGPIETVVETLEASDGA